MVVPLPIGEPEHGRRLQLIAAETARRKTNAHPQMGSGIFRFAAAQRVLGVGRAVNVSVQTYVARLFLGGGVLECLGGVTGG